MSERVVPKRDRGLRPDGRVDFEACEQIARAGGPLSKALSSLSERHPLPDGSEAPPVRAPRATAPDCAHCRENCCVAPHVLRLTLTDVANLIDVGLGWAVARPTRSALPVLGRGASPEWPSLKHHEGRCVFLDSKDRCSIYAIRPAGCRTFPYQLAEDGTYIRYANTCRFTKHDAEAARSMIEAVSTRQRARRSDLQLEAQAPGDLEALALLEYLRGPAPRPDPQKPFRAVLDEALGEPE